MARFSINDDYLKRILEDLINTPSPTGDTEWAISFVEQELDSMGLRTFRTTKGALIAHFEGLQQDRPRALTAHLDTLGAMVAEVKSSGRLRLTALNGLEWNSVESEGIWVQTQQGRQIRGSLVLHNGAVHVNSAVKTAPRNAETLEVRLDVPTTSADETRLLGIEVGDFVYFDPRLEIGDSGFIRSRFLDDKACVAAVLAALKALTDAGVHPVQRTHILFSNYEEVGHGGADGLPDDLDEYVVLDMACVGDGQNGDEMHCSICVKDSSGPYSRRLTEKLRAIASRAGIELKPDVYPYYGSDGSMYWRTGGRAEVALIGPGVDNSHCYERTHISAVRDTALLISEYLIED
ncbi:MAG: M42 family metallopeptidase [Armatimonadetes bacterium]|nr:M42 family metallopeptidase [Armatimonadota bacterium]